MKNRWIKQAGHEYSENQRLVFLLFLAPVFLFLLPLLIVFLGRKIDAWLNLAPILPGPANLIVGLLLIVPGFFLAMWSNYNQFTIGRGTPVPLMATQKLIVQPPYSFCRNPMALGTFLGYMGIAALFGSIGAMAVVGLLTLLLLFYIKRVEEKEMEIRFGQEYLAYKKQTPFLIPRLWKRRN